MAKKYADIRIEITVEFDDDGETDLKSQAIEAIGDYDFSPFDMDAEVVGEVRDTP